MPKYLCLIISCHFLVEVVAMAAEQLRNGQYFAKIDLQFSIYFEYFSVNVFKLC